MGNFKGYNKLKITFLNLRRLSDTPPAPLRILKLLEAQPLVNNKQHLIILDKQKLLIRSFSPFRVGPFMTGISLNVKLGI